MKTSWFTFLFPPHFSIYEQAQKAKLLHFMLLADFIGSLVTGITNFAHGWYNEATFLFLFAVICLVGFYLNRTRYFNVAAFILCFSIFLLAGLLMYNGIGLYDTAVLVYPVFMICATFLFGRRGLVTATVLSILSVLGIYVLGVYGVFLSSYEASFLRAIITSFLFSIMAIVIWVVHDTWETNLLNLRESYDLTLQGWSRALEYRDGETAGHSRRVAELSVKLARKLGFADENLRGIERGAYLHDIGKMAIPDKILLKTGPLTKKEWEFMRLHPVRSRDLISDIPYLQPAAQLAYSHHERWDGSGYPDGLSGEDIPLGARIFAVIDNWDALNSDRPYRQAWPREEVVAYLRKNSGSIFDPEIVSVFLEIVERNQ